MDTLRCYLSGIWYFIRHKWYVFRACCKYKLYRAAITHDLSKLLPSEFFPYARFFHGSNPPQKDENGYYHKPGLVEEMDIAWLKHQRRNPHHWQYWVLLEDCGNTKVLEMPDKYVREMVCDWVGAHKAQKAKGTVRDWYDKNKDKMTLHPDTQKRIEELLKLWGV